VKGASTISGGGEGGLTVDEALNVTSSSGPRPSSVVASRVTTRLASVELGGASGAILQGMGSQETLPASRAYPTNATASIVTCAITKGIVRPVR